MWAFHGAGVEWLPAGQLLRAAVGFAGWRAAWEALKNAEAS